MSQPPRSPDQPASAQGARTAGIRRPPATGSRRVLALACAAAVVWMASALTNQYARTYALGRQAAELEQQRRDLIASNQALRDEIQRLKTDDGYLEWLARKELGMVRPGEVEFLIVSPHKTSTANGRDAAGSAPTDQGGSETVAPGQGRSVPQTGGVPALHQNQRGSHAAFEEWLGRLLARLASLLEQLRSGR